MTLRVYYEDTDAGGVVYHTNYIKYCERARSEVLFQKGLSPNVADCHFVVSSLCCNFLKPAKLGDLLEIDAVVTELKNVSMTMHQNIYRGEQKIFEMDVKVGFINSNGKLIKIPQKLKDILEDEPNKAHFAIAP